MLKKKLRADYKIRRKLISDKFLLNSSQAIASASLELSVWHHRYFHVFLPISRQKEIDTHFLIDVLNKKGKDIVVPKVFGERRLKHYLLTESTTIEASHWNIPEPVGGIEILPEQIDVVFIPLLAFDQQGNRVGYGKGFYDRFLAECRDDVVKIGLSLFEAEELIEDVEENDIALDYCVTPSKVYSFSN